jgi:hypothetical protein
MKFLYQTNQPMTSSNPTLKRKFHSFPVSPPPIPSPTPMFCDLPRRSLPTAILCQIFPQPHSSTDTPSINTDSPPTWLATSSHPTTPLSLPSSLLTARKRNSLSRKLCLWKITNMKSYQLSKESSRRCSQPTKSYTSLTSQIFHPTLCSSASSCFSS